MGITYLQLRHGDAELHKACLPVAIDAALS
jgi:hypothetical protein